MGVTLPQLCVLRSEISEFAKILTFSQNLIRIRSDFTLLSKKKAKNDLQSIH